jgi:hypothetical protein
MQQLDDVRVRLDATKKDIEKKERMKKEIEEEIKKSRDQYGVLMQSADIIKSKAADQLGLN